MGHASPIWVTSRKFGVSMARTVIISSLPGSRESSFFPAFPLFLFQRTTSDIFRLLKSSLFFERGWWLSEGSRVEISSQVDLGCFIRVPSLVPNLIPFPSFGSFSHLFSGTIEGTKLPHLTNQLTDFHSTFANLVSQMTGNERTRESSLYVTLFSTKNLL